MKGNNFKLPNIFLLPFCYRNFSLYKGIYRLIVTSNNIYSIKSIVVIRYYSKMSNASICNI